MGQKLTQVMLIATRRDRAALWPVMSAVHVQIHARGGRARGADEFGPVDHSA